MRNILVAAIFAATSGTLPTIAQAAGNNWITCAAEGEKCVVPNSSTEVYYGKNGAYHIQSGTTEIRCENKKFNGDPLERKSKHCYFDMGDPKEKEWKHCSNEGERCKFEGAKLVRYGKDDKWVYKAFIAEVKCDNGEMGNPNSGTEKSCQIAN